MRRALVFPIYRLEEEGYSKRPGCLCLIEEELGNSLTVRWLHPFSGMSSGILRADLAEVGELTLLLDLVLAAIADG